MSPKQRKFPVINFQKFHNLFFSHKKVISVEKPLPGTGHWIQLSLHPLTSGGTQNRDLTEYKCLGHHDSRIERIVDVGPIWNGGEAEKKIETYLADNLLNESWQWNTMWHSHRGTSYAVLSVLILVRKLRYSPCFRGSGEQEILCVEKHNGIDLKLRPPLFSGPENNGGVSC